MHLDISAGAVFSALVAALAEFKFKFIRLIGKQRFDNCTVLTETPALPAFEARPAAETAFGFIDAILFAECLQDFGFQRFQPF